MQKTEVGRHRKWVDTGSELLRFEIGNDRECGGSSISQLNNTELEKRRENNRAFTKWNGNSVNSANSGKLIYH